MAVSRTLFFFIILMTTLGSGCRDGHFEKTKSLEQSLAWNVENFKSTPCEDNECFQISFQIRAKLESSAVKNYELEYKVEGAGSSNWKLVRTGSEGEVDVAMKIPSTTWFSGDEKSLIVIVRNSNLLEHRVFLNLRATNGNLQRIEQLSEPHSRTGLTREGRIQARILSSKILNRKARSLSEEEVEWQILIQFEDTDSGEVVRGKKMRWMYANRDWVNAKINSLGQTTLKFKDVHRPIDHERLISRSLLIKAPGAEIPTELSFQFTLEKSRPTPIFFTGEDPLAFKATPTNAPKFAIDVLSAVSQNRDVSLLWSNTLQPSWQREDEIRIRVFVQRYLLDRQEITTRPGLEARIVLDAIKKDSSLCDIDSTPYEWSGLVTEEPIALYLKSKFDRASCRESDFYWRVRVRAKNAPRVQPTWFLIDSKTLRISLIENSFDEEPFSDGAINDPISYPLPSEFEDLIASPMDESIRPRLMSLYEYQLKRDRDLSKFISGREKTMQLVAIKSLRWVSVKSSKSVEGKTRFIKLIDDQDFVLRQWSSTLSGEARPCIVMVLEVIPRISGSPYFTGEKRKVRAFCSGTSQSVANWSENLASFTTLQENAESPAREKIIRGFWLARLTENFSDSLLNEYNLLLHPELYFWGSTIASKNFDLLTP